MTRGAHLRGDSVARYRAEVREPMTRMRAWLPGFYDSSQIQAILTSILVNYPEIGSIPYEPAPATRTGLTRCYLRITQGQRGMIDLMARIHGTPGEPLPVSETLRGIICAWMEE